jgi:hypothetical protein
MFLLSCELQSTSRNIEFDHHILPFKFYYIKFIYHVNVTHNVFITYWNLIVSTAKKPVDIVSIPLRI